MTFTTIFGKTYRRNPNIIDTNFTSEETQFIITELQRTVATEEESALLINPCIKKLGKKKPELLNSELHFIQEALMYNMSKQPLDKSFFKVYLNCISKLERYLSLKNILLNRKKAEL